MHCSAEKQLFAASSCGIVSHGKTPSIRQSHLRIHLRRMNTNPIAKLDNYNSYIQKSWYIQTGYDKNKSHYRQ